MPARTVSTVFTISREKRRAGAARRRRALSFWGPVLLVLGALPVLAASSLSDRLTEAYLAPQHQAVVRLRAQARPAQPVAPLQDVRCVLHAHSRLSHDSRGTPEEITAAAKAVGVRAVFMTEHPTPDGKWRTEGMRGMRDGVLFVPGAELSDGLLVWRGEKASWTPEMKAREVLDRLKETDGVAFIAHPEMRTEDAAWELPPFAGMEIYNTHADAKDSNFEKVLASVRGGNLLKTLQLAQTLKKYPQEAFAAVFDEQTAVLRRWDRLNVQYLSSGRRVVGIAANDSHQNVGVSVESTAEGLSVKDGLGEQVAQVPKAKLPFLLAGTPPGQTLLQHTFDPYPVSFGYVNTHLLATEVTEPTLFEALLAGRAYVSFDWMADPTGFRFEGDQAGRSVPMGSLVEASGGPVHLTVRPNMPCELRLLRNGEEVAKGEAEELTFEARDPGVYRAEAWVTLGAEKRPWVYSNPIYVR